MKHKTQVFFAPSNDHICTRIEHALHVSSIASTICKGLGLDDELSWAIGMGHDLGHTPFGHIGETILSSMMEKAGVGPFEHEVHSLRIVDFISNHGQGMDLTYAVRDGIVCHCGEKFLHHLKPEQEVKDLGAITSKDGLVPSTWEGVVVRFSDSIAYLGRDWEDACRLRLIHRNELPETVAKVLGNSNSKIIDTLVKDVIENSDEQSGISFSDRVYEAVCLMKEYNYQHIYRSPMLGGYRKYYTRLLDLIVSYLGELLTQYGNDINGYCSEKNLLAVGFGRYVREMEEPYRDHDGTTDRLIFDYVAGMSDNFAQSCANEILIPEHLDDSIEYSLKGRWIDGD
jgi:dGTPase